MILSSPIRCRLAGGLVSLVGVVTMLLTGADAASAVAVGGQPVGEIRSVGTARVKANSFIVVLNDTAGLAASDVDVTQRSLLARYGGVPGHSYRHTIRGFEVSMSELAARRLAAHPAVAYVQPNTIHTLAATQTSTPSWGLDRIDQRTRPLNNTYTYPVTGQGVTIYIIDSGVQGNHIEFGGRVRAGLNALAGDPTPSNVDCNGHGTHVAATAAGATYGVAKGATIFAVKTFLCSGMGPDSDIIQGIDWVTAHHTNGPAVANLSFETESQNTPAVEQAVNRSIADGITYVAAAGNSNVDACTVAPGGLSDVIGVGAVNNTDARAVSSYWGSNWGSCVDIFAPGVDIVSASPYDSQTGAPSDSGFATRSGTSMATPHVTGAAALVLAADPSITPWQVRDKLVANAATGVVTNPGSGSPNRLLQVVNGAPTPDFTISATPGSASTPANGTLVVSIKTTQIGSTPQWVSLGVGGVPAGTLGLLHAREFGAGGYDVLTLIGLGTTTPGTYPIAITGTTAWSSRTVTYWLTITPSSRCRGEMLVNPGFELGTAPWVEYPTVITSGPAARTGTGVAHLGGYGFSSTQWMSQGLTLPAGCFVNELSFWTRILTQESNVGVYDTLTVQIIRGTTVTDVGVYSNRDASTGYVKRTIDLSAFAGKTIKIRFRSTEDGSVPTSFFVDDTSLRVL